MNMSPENITTLIIAIVLGIYFIKLTRSDIKMRREQKEIEAGIAQQERDETDE